jgi:hypothetical protein
MLVSRGRSNACNPLAPRIDKNLGNPVVKRCRYVCSDRRWIRLLSINTCLNRARRGGKRRPVGYGNQGVH